jgi:hypothetical protein
MRNLSTSRQFRIMRIDSIFTAKTLQDAEFIGDLSDAFHNIEWFDLIRSQSHLGGADLSPHFT